MATTNTITTTYAGADAKKFVSAALLMGTSIQNNLITVLPNLQGNKQIMHKLALNGIVKNATCDFDPTSTITQTERILTLEEFQVNLQICKTAYFNTWQSAEMGASAHSVLPKSFADYLLGLIADKVSASVETTIWSGVNATAGQWDGFETLLAADANLPSANEVGGTTVTASNVIEEMNKIYTAIPAALFGHPDLKIYVAQNIMKAYVAALGGFSVAATSNNGINNGGTMWYAGGQVTFNGVPVVMVNGMTANVAICTTSDNLFFGTKLLSDFNEAKILDMSPLDGSQNVRIVYRFVAGCQYAVVEDIITYGITNSAN